MAPGTEVVAGDLLDAASLGPALAACTRPTTSSTRWARPAASRRRTGRPPGTSHAAARAAGVRRIVYLGGLGDDADGLSTASAQPAGGGGVPPGVRRAGPRIPRLHHHRLGQPVLRDGARPGRAAAGDGDARAGCASRPSRSPSTTCSAYLHGGAGPPASGKRIFEIGGPDRVSYGELMREYARQRGLRRAMIPVPVLTPGCPASGSGW